MFCTIHFDITIRHPGGLGGIGLVEHLPSLTSQKALWKLKIQQFSTDAAETHQKHSKTLKKTIRIVQKTPKRNSSIPPAARWKASLAAVSPSLTSNQQPNPPAEHWNLAPPGASPQVSQVPQVPQVHIPLPPTSTFFHYTTVPNC